MADADADGEAASAMIDAGEGLSRLQLRTANAQPTRHTVLEKRERERIRRSYRTSFEQSMTFAK
jgi:hypothetical protein